MILVKKGAVDVFVSECYSKDLNRQSYELLFNFCVILLKKKTLFGYSTTDGRAFYNVYTQYLHIMA